MGEMEDLRAVAADELRSFIERIERLDEEIADLKEDRKEVLAEAKGRGFDTKAIQQIVKDRRTPKAERDSYEAILDLYREALGDFIDTPLGAAAVARAAA